MAYTAVNPYITIKDLCEELKREVPAAGTDLEDELKGAIDRASRWVDDWTGSDYYEHNYLITPLILDENSPGVFDNQIFLPYKPVLSITSLTYGGASPVTLVQDVDFRIGTGKSDGILFRFQDDWRPGWPDEVIKIYGKFGYDQGGISSTVPVGLPGRIVIATRLVAAAFSGHNRKEHLGLDGQKVDLIENEIPKIVFTTLGKKLPILT